MRKGGSVYRAEEELWRQRHDPCQEMMAGRAIQPLLEMMRAVDEKMYAAQKKHAECTRMWFSAQGQRMAAEEAVRRMRRQSDL